MTSFSSPARLLAIALVSAFVSAAIPNDTCSQIGSAISSASDVYYPLDLTGDYLNDIHHWATSSTQNAACSVEPGTAEDVGKILRIVGSTRTPFAVKGGGHIANPEFSSTTGVQIAMYRFSEVSYDQASQTVTVGSGLVWDAVYDYLDPYAVNVVGGRVSGVGVAGFTLGGGKYLNCYSWKTNQYGLTADNVVAFELVKPDGSVVNVTESSDEDLFFGLRGGFNNFGIVTRFTFKAYPQTDVWGGLIIYTGDEIPAVINATAKFSATVKDPKASLITTLNFALVSPGVIQLLFYDAPEPPSGIFDDYLAIPSLIKDVGTKSFKSFVQGIPANISDGARAIFQTVSLEKLSPNVLATIVNETNYWGSHLGLQSGDLISYDIEPFASDYLSHSASPSAYPSRRNTSYLPLNVYYSYLSPLADDQFHNAVKESAQRIKDVAQQEGQNIENAEMYPNYCIYDTPLENMYGDNVPRLKQIKAEVDPDNVMGLAGGFKF